MRSKKALDWLIQYIIRNNLECGACLPGEIEISKKLGVGRSAVREAVAVLKAFGIVSSKTGVGPIVIADSRQLVLIRLFRSESFDLADYLMARELRDFIEMGAAGVMTKNVTAKQIEKLRRLITMVSLKEDSPITPLEFEIRFHEQLAFMTNNHFIIALSILYRPLFEYHIGHIISAYDSKVIPDTVIADHTKVVDALEKKNHKALVETLQLQITAYKRRAKTSGRE